MKILTTCMLFLVITSTWAIGQNNTAAPDVESIVAKANLAAYYQGNDGKAKVHMLITDKKGQTREREFVILRKDQSDGGDQHFYVYFNKPSDIRRMAYLVHKYTGGNRDDDRWFFLPALSLVKRIAAGDKRTSFVGSDFLYEDVSGRGLAEDTHELVQTTDQYYLIQNTPKKPDSVEFSHFTVTIDKTSFMPMKMEYFDKAGTLYRVIESKNVETIQDLPTVTQSEVRDLKTGSTTTMTFSNVTYNLNLTDEIFTERYLQRPPQEALR